MKIDFDAGIVARAAVAFVVLFAIFMTIPLILLNAWVVTKLWHWYIVRAFGAPEITMVTAFGMSLLYNMLQHQYHVEDKREAYAKVISLIAAPIFALLMGWIGTFFM